MHIERLNNQIAILREIEAQERPFILQQWFDATHGSVEAACRLLDVPPKTIDYMFKPEGYSGKDASTITPARVIRRVEKVLGIDVADRRAPTDDQQPPTETPR